MTDATRPQSEASFDLMEQRLAKIRYTRAARILMTCVFVGMLLVLILILEAALSPNGLATSLEWTQLLVLAPGIGLILGMMAIGVWKLGPSPTRVLVAKVGVTLQWGESSQLKLHWKDLPKGGFSLLDYSIDPLSARMTENLWELRRRASPISFLSREAFMAIIEAAASAGLDVDSAVPVGTDFRNNFWGRYGCRVTTFKLAASGRLNPSA